MWALVLIAHLWMHFCFTLPLKTGRGLQRQNCSQQNSAQCWSLLDFQKIFTIFRNIIIWILNSLEMEIFENVKNLV